MPSGARHPVRAAAHGTYLADPLGQLRRPDRLADRPLPLRRSSKWGSAALPGWGRLRGHDRGATALRRCPRRRLSPGASSTRMGPTSGPVGGLATTPRAAVTPPLDVRLLTLLHEASHKREKRLLLESRWCLTHPKSSPTCLSVVFRPALPAWGSRRWPCSPKGGVTKAITAFSRPKCT